MKRHVQLASCLLLSAAAAAAQQLPQPSAMHAISTISLDALLQEERQL